MDTVTGATNTRTDRWDLSPTVQLTTGARRGPLKGKLDGTQGDKGGPVPQD